MATLFIGSLVPGHLAGLISASAVVGVATLGVLLTFLASWTLSRTVLQGEVSSFSLELPPYRPPRLGQTLCRSLIDRIAVVDWNEQQQIERTARRPGVGVDQARAILAAQGSRAARLAIADYIIDKRAGLAELEARVRQLHQAYLDAAQHAKKTT